MARLHIHLAVDDLTRNIDFYSALFGAAPSMVQADYAKWQLDEPKVNFAISTRSRQSGLDHLGIQSDNATEQEQIERRLQAANIGGTAESNTTCCYARSDKYWTLDPQGIAWETFHTLASAPTFHAPTAAAPEAASDATTSCCAPGTGSCC